MYPGEILPIVAKLPKVIFKSEPKMTFWTPNLSLEDFLNEVNTEISQKSRDQYKQVGLELTKCFKLPDRKGDIDNCFGTYVDSNNALFCVQCSDWSGHEALTTNPLLYQY